METWWNKFFFYDREGSAKLQTTKTIKKDTLILLSKESILQEKLIFIKCREQGEGKSNAV